MEVSIPEHKAMRSKLWNQQWCRRNNRLYVKTGNGCTVFRQNPTHTRRRLIGLEKETWREKRTGKRRRFRGYKAGFEEQGFQWDEGICDVEHVARVYKRASDTSAALAEAQKLAMQDAKEVAEEKSASVSSKVSKKKSNRKRKHTSKRRNSVSSNASNSSSESSDTCKSPKRKIRKGKNKTV